MGLESGAGLEDDGIAQKMMLTMQGCVVMTKTIIILCMKWTMWECVLVTELFCVKAIILNRKFSKGKKALLFTAPCKISLLANNSLYI